MSGHNPPQFAPDDPNANSGAYGNHGQREKHPVKPELRTSGGRQSPGKWFGTLGQLDFDIDFFEKLLVRNGSSVEVLRTLAELVSRKGMMQRAVEVDRMLVDRLPEDCLARYNLACSLALAHMPDEAIASLSKAVGLGYDDVTHMDMDPDLDSLRNRPDFLALLGRKE